MRSTRPRLASALLAGAALCPLTAQAAPPPAIVRTLEDTLHQTAAVVEGHVEDVSYRYDEAEGPRTVATLSRLKLHLGSLGPASPPSIELRSFGGPLPDGREVSATHVPALLAGKRYLIFLRNTEWSLSPVVAGLALRVEVASSAPVVIDQHGRLVRGLSGAGLVPGPFLFAEPSNGEHTPGGPERIGPWITPDVARDALDVNELVREVRAFAASRHVWPSGAFSPFPVTRGPSWRWVSAPPPAEPEPDDRDDVDDGDDGALACLAEPGGDAVIDADLLVCTDGGGM